MVMMWLKRHEPPASCPIYSSHRFAQAADDENTGQCGQCARGVGNEISHGLMDAVLDVRVMNDIRVQLRKLPEQANGASQRKSEDVTCEGRERSKPVRETIQRMPKKEGDGDSAAVMHCKIERLSPRRVINDTVENKHQ